MSRKIMTEQQTIQYLSDKALIKDFILELQEYLKMRVCHYQDANGAIQYACDCDPHDDDIVIRKKNFIKFCSKKRLHWNAANTFLFDKMSSFLCDSDLIYDLEIDDKGNIIYK